MQVTFGLGGNEKVLPPSQGLAADLGFCEICGKVTSFPLAFCQHLGAHTPTKEHQLDRGPWWSSQLHNKDENQMCGPQHVLT